MQFLVSPDGREVAREIILDFLSPTGVVWIDQPCAVHPRPQWKDGRALAMYYQLLRSIFQWCNRGANSFFVDETFVIQN
jgi:hypothetical protein